MGIRGRESFLQPPAPFLSLFLTLQGTYATVYKGKSKLTDNLVALKEIRLEHEEGAPCTAIREGTVTQEGRPRLPGLSPCLIHTHPTVSTEPGGFGTSLLTLWPSVESAHRADI